MKDLKYIVEQSRKKHKDAVEEYKELRKHLQKTLTYYNSTSDCNIFKRALTLLTNEKFKEYTDWSDGGYRITEATIWKTNEYRDFYYIQEKDYSDFYDSRRSRILDSYSTTNIGFVCRLEHLYKALDSEMFDLWQFHCKEDKFEESLADFRSFCEVGLIDLFDVYNSYMSRKNDKFVLDLVNDNVLKIKKIVIFMKTNTMQYD